MNATSLALQNAFQSGSCAAVPRVNRRARAQGARAFKDYCLFDAEGKRLGTIVSPSMRPVLEKNAPTFYLGRTEGLPSTKSASD